MLASLCMQAEPVPKCGITGSLHSNTFSTMFTRNLLNHWLTRFSEKKQKLEDIKKNIRDAILVSRFSQIHDFVYLRPLGWLFNMAVLSAIYTNTLMHFCADFALFMLIAVLLPPLLCWNSRSRWPMSHIGAFVTPVDLVVKYTLVIAYCNWTKPQYICHKSAWSSQFNLLINIGPTCQSRLKVLNDF